MGKVKDLIDQAREKKHDSLHIDIESLITFAYIAKDKYFQDQKDCDFEFWKDTLEYCLQSCNLSLSESQETWLAEEYKQCNKISVERAVLKNAKLHMMSQNDLSLVAKEAKRLVAAGDNAGLIELFRRVHTGCWANGFVSMTLIARDAVKGHYYVQTREVGDAELASGKAMDFYEALAWLAERYNCHGKKKSTEIIDRDMLEKQRYEDAKKVVEDYEGKYTIHLRR